jgi:hypothetical protein
VQGEGVLISVACMQTAVIEFARNELGLADANSAEFEPATPTPVVVFMPEGSTTHKGGTMRLGSRKTILQTMDCITARLYQARISTAPPYTYEQRHYTLVNRALLLCPGSCHKLANARPYSGSDDKAVPTSAATNQPAMPVPTLVATAAPHTGPPHLAPCARND